MEKLYTVIEGKDNLPEFIQTINTMRNKQGAELLGGISVVPGVMGQRQYYQSMLVNAEAPKEQGTQHKHTPKK